MNENIYRNLFVELEMYEHSGVSMKLGDNPASPMQIVTAHMTREEQSYMRDYVWDEDGHLKDLSFDEVKVNS